MDNAFARAEAVSLFRLVGRYGNTVESLRELIGVPANTKRALLAYAAAERSDAYAVQGALQYRKAVAAEFEKLVSH